MGNEPGFFIPYLYNHANVAWKTQSRIRTLLVQFFKGSVFNIPGNENGGAMSAFQVLSFIGFYPVMPALPIYAISSPASSKIPLVLPGNKQFTIIANNNSNNNKYIQGAKLNGQPWNYPFLHISS